MDIKRRNFLVYASMVTFSPHLDARSDLKFERKFKEVKEIIYAVQKHMFPVNTIVSLVEKPSVIAFIFKTLAHKSFDKEIRVFVIEGAQEFAQRTQGKFFTMSYKDREKALRAYEETEYGSAWLSRIMTLTFEGMLSDPIYGANEEGRGWKALHTSGGEPRPKKRYLNV